MGKPELHKLTDNAKKKFDLFKTFLGFIKNDEDNEAIQQFCSDVIGNVDILQADALYANLECIDERCGLLKDQDRCPPYRHDGQSIPCKFYSCRKKIEMAAKRNVAEQGFLSLTLARFSNDYKFQWVFAYAGRILKIIETSSNSLNTQIDGINKFINTLRHIQKKAKDIYQDNEEAKFKFYEQIDDILKPLNELSNELQVYQEQLTLKDKIEQLNNDLIAVIAYSSHCLAFNALGIGEFEPLEHEDYDSLYSLYTTSVREIRSEWISGCYSFPNFLLYLTTQNEKSEEAMPAFKVNVPDYYKRVQILDYISHELTKLAYNNTKQDRENGLKQLATHINNKCGYEKFGAQGGRIRFIGGSEDYHSCINRLVDLWAKRLGKSDNEVGQKITYIQSIYARYCWRISNIVYLQELQSDLAGEAVSIGQIAIAKFNPLKHLFLAVSALCKHHIRKTGELSKEYITTINALSNTFKKGIKHDNEHKLLFTNFISEINSMDEKLQSLLSRQNNIEDQIDHIKSQISRWSSKEHCKKTAQKLRRIYDGCLSVIQDTRQVDSDLDDTFECLDLSVDDIFQMPSLTAGFIDKATTSVGSDVTNQFLNGLQREQSVPVFRTTSQSFSPLKKEKSEGAIHHDLITKNNTIASPTQDRKEQILETFGIKVEGINIDIANNESWSLIMTLLADKIYTCLKNNANYQDDNQRDKYPGLSIINPLGSYYDYQWYFVSFNQWLETLALYSDSDQADPEVMLKNLTQIFKKHRLYTRSWLSGGGEAESQEASNIENNIVQLGLTYNGDETFFRIYPPLSLDDISIMPDRLLDPKDSQAFKREQPFVIVVLLRLLSDNKIHGPEKRLLSNNQHTYLNVDEVNKVANKTLEAFNQAINNGSNRYDRQSNNNTHLNQSPITWVNNKFYEYYQSALDNKKQQENARIRQEEENEQLRRQQHNVDIHQSQTNYRHSINLESVVCEAAQDYKMHHNPQGPCKKKSYQFTMDFLRRHHKHYDIRQLILNVYGYIGDNWNNKDANLNLRVRILNKLNQQLTHEYKAPVTENEQAISQSNAKTTIKGLLIHNHTTHEHRQNELIDIVVDVIVRNLLKDGNAGAYTPNKRINKSANVLHYFKDVLDEGYYYPDLANKIYKRCQKQSICEDDFASTDEQQTQLVLQDKIDTFLNELSQSTSCFKWFLSDSYTGSEIKSKIQPLADDQISTMACN